MAKNRKYENVYQITLTGSATNGFTPKCKHDIIKATIQAMQATWPGDVLLEVIKTKGDFNAITEEVEL